MGRDICKPGVVDKRYRPWFLPQRIKGKRYVLQVPLPRNMSWRQDFFNTKQHDENCHQKRVQSGFHWGRLCRVQNRVLHGGRLLLPLSPARRPFRSPGRFGNIFHGSLRIRLAVHIFHATCTFIQRRRRPACQAKLVEHR